MSSLVKAIGGLWEHQRAAIEAVRRYLAHAPAHHDAALVTMPTGTGKTGVIASAAMNLPEVSGHRLVLTPWDALRTQLIEDLRGRFWDRLPANARPEMLPVKRLPAASALETVLDADPTVYVTTIAALSEAAKTADEGAYDLARVFADFGVVLVDEGHYEPAPQWSDAIRSLKRPTVLLTATPYRNDEKYFEIDQAHRYRYQHWKAEEQGFLRKPEFLRIDDDATPDAFAAELLHIVDERFPEPDDARIIVRCRTSLGIRDVVQALDALNQSVVGVHETFPPGDPVLRNAVPRPEESAARFWVHQNKLIEGIDDPRFRVIAFYDALRNDRATIQQIGRVLRNPARDPKDSVALVLDRGDRDVERTWQAYRDFDRHEWAESAATMPQLVERVLKAQPAAFYYDGAYRTRIDLDSPGAWEDFAFPLRTRVFRRIAGDQCTLDDLALETAYQWSNRERTVFRTQEPDRRTRIVPFITAENSRFLRSGTFIEPRFGYTIIRMSRDRLFYYDTRGATPEAVEQHFQPLGPTDLQVLFPKGDSSLTSVFLLNTDVGQQAPRSRQVRAAAIDDLAPDLADYAYMCTVAEGYTEISGERFRRYLGLSRARVSDYRPGDRDFAGYNAWLDGLEASLGASTSAAVTFSRYAAHVDEPADKTVEHILLDIEPARFVKGGTDIPLEVEDTASAVLDGHFSLTVNGVTHQIELDWDQNRSRYQLTSPSLASEHFVSRDGEPRDLLGAINGDQAMRLVSADRKTMYAHGSFFRPIIPATRLGAFRLLDVLCPVPALAQAASEKGTKIDDDDWQPNTVFGLISALAPTSGRSAPEVMKALFTTPDLVLCTDLGSEVADFLVTGPTRVAFIHAKASHDTRHYSASALHEVAAQAIKNLHHLQPLADIPMPAQNWMKSWKAKGVEGTTARLRHGQFSSGSDIWKHVRERIADPNTDREVWLVVGNSLSRSALEKQAKKAKPAAEAIQVFSLLQTTWGAVSQLGARLRVFCSP
ncbi:DEAD/DEAH box helicase [Jatrophihabitans fulvus]